MRGVLRVKVCPAGPGRAGRSLPAGLQPPLSGRLCRRRAQPLSALRWFLHPGYHGDGATLVLPTLEAGKLQGGEER